MKGKPLKGEVRTLEPLTQEEKQEQAARMYMQKRESIATGVLFNLMSNSCLFDRNIRVVNFEDINPSVVNFEGINPTKIASFAVEVADKMIEKLYFTKEE